MKKVMSIILIITISFMLMTGCGKINKLCRNSGSNTSNGSLTCYYSC